MTPLNCLTPKNAGLMQETRRYLLCKPSYSYFCAKISYYVNKGRSDVNFNTTIKFSDHDFLEDQKSFCDFGRVYYVVP